MALSAKFGYRFHMTGFCCMGHSLCIMYYYYWEAYLSLEEKDLYCDSVNREWLHQRVVAARSLWWYT